MFKDPKIPEEPILYIKGKKESEELASIHRCDITAKLRKSCKLQQ